MTNQKLAPQRKFLPFSTSQQFNSILQFKSLYLFFNTYIPLISHIPSSYTSIFISKVCVIMFLFLYYFLKLIFLLFSASLTFWTLLFYIIGMFLALLRPKMLSYILFPSFSPFLYVLLLYGIFKFFFLTFSKGFCFSYTTWLSLCHTQGGRGYNGLTPFGWWSSARG